MYTTKLKICYDKLFLETPSYIIILLKLYCNKIISSPDNLCTYTKFIFIFSNKNLPSLVFKFEYIDVLEMKQISVLYPS